MNTVYFCILFFLFCISNACVNVAPEFTAVESKPIKQFFISAPKNECIVLSFKLNKHGVVEYEEIKNAKTNTIKECLKDKIVLGYDIKNHIELESTIETNYRIFSGTIDED